MEKIKMNKKGGFFGFIFMILGFLVFLVALAIIILIAYFIFVYGFPIFKETIIKIINERV